MTAVRTSFTIKSSLTIELLEAKLNVKAFDQIAVPV
jgi:hypothetical protein